MDHVSKSTTMKMTFLQLFKNTNLMYGYGMVMLLTQMTSLTMDVNLKYVNQGMVVLKSNTFGDSVMPAEYVKNEFARTSN